MIKLSGTATSTFRITTTEQVYPLGLHPDGSTLYCKYVAFGTMPNATTKQVAHNLTNYSLYRFEAFLKAPDGTILALNAVDTLLNDSTWARFYVNPTHIVVTTSFDYTGFSAPYVELYYKKV